MKKICSFLGAISLTAFTSSTVVACNGGLDMSLKYSDQQKINSIYNLKTEDLTKNGVKINQLINSEDIDKIFESLGLNEIVANHPEGAIIKKSIGIYIMANQFLNEISSKVSGYGWIANKLTWQSQWAIKDMLKDGSTSIFNNVSGWMTDKNNQWSLSVTFLDEDKMGWNGVNPLKYARININRMLVSDSAGFVEKESSNYEGIYGTDPNVQSGFINPNNQELGVIYQGFANSSRLLDLSEILNETPGSIPVGFFNYSPSVADFVNNKIINLDFGNLILQNSKQEIEYQLNEYLLDNPIYIGEGLNYSQIDDIIKNQIYLVLISNAIDRENLENENGGPLFDQDEKEEAATLLPAMVSKLQISLENLSKNDWITQETKVEIEAINSILEDVIKNKYNFINPDQKDQFKLHFKQIIINSRNLNDPNSGQFKFYVGDISATLYKAATSTPDNNEILSSESAYTNFGYDSSYKFKVYYWSKVTPITGKENQWYSPDDLRPKNEYISDKGFRNIFWSNRFLNTYNTEKPLLLLQYFEKVGRAIDIFEFDDSIQNPTLDDVNNKMRIALEKAVSLDKNNNSENLSDDSWRIYHLMALINNSATKMLKDIFSIDENGILEIHNQQISLDYSKNPNSLDPKNADDDIAFGELINNEQIPFIVNDFSRTNKGNARSGIYENGINWLWRGEAISLTMFIGRTNIFGKRFDISLDNMNQWWNQSGRDSQEHQFLIKIPNQYQGLLEYYWNQYVAKNPNNQDYNPNL
ncbi:lipoprotein [Spiroplasma diminutum]|uniref:Lipoprotein n=1 Tax=Spiroplasma diminutum CUAS-1 TaxID=1276221 RepID=S5M0B3_9MOLU|nr:lipoprotein [Spiroplasma diminutum]AGR42281.1 hypothetical protein SDIMI_v3c05770 [Spiroplasma diminutum CUAS-1]